MPKKRKTRTISPAAAIRKRLRFGDTAFFKKRSTAFKFAKTVGGKVKKVTLPFLGRGFLVEKPF